MMLRSEDGGVTVAIPIRIQRYSGRRQVVVPQGISAALPGQRAPTALQVALARGATVGCGRSRVGKPAISQRSLIEKRSTAATSAAGST